MIYSVYLTTKAQKQLEKLTKTNLKLALKLTALLELLAATSDPHINLKCKKLKGSANSYRWRLGDYRVVGEITDRLLIITIAHRKEAYK